MRDCREIPLKQAFVSAPETLGRELRAYDRKRSKLDR